MASYDFAGIEAKWQQRWRDEKYHETDLSRSDNKCYCLVMFPYPSGEKLHLGHWMSYVPVDAWARFRRMQGYNVFQPIGFDSFGLPAENFAIKCGVHPRIHTEENMVFIREQLHSLGAMHDWSCEVATHRPDFYRWTQWLFLQLFHHDLAYRAAMPVNWCNSCQTVLANEQVSDGACERCKSQVERQNRTQWCFRITAYADRLIDDLDRVEWPEETVKKQRSWIGRSVGAEVEFQVPAMSLSGELPEGWERDEDGGVNLRVFTTRPDTLFGATYMVIAPEHPLVSALTSQDNRDAVTDYVRRARLLSEVDRASGSLEKSGVPTGAVAINPVNGESIPIWVADYVLASYGTGAVMAVPAHDTRDFEFAQTFSLPIRKVILAPGDEPDSPLTEAYTESGTMLQSGEFNGLANGEGGKRIVAELAAENRGRAAVQYRLRDWLVSRQRFWGAPIPIVHCPDCGEVPVPEEELPVELPDDVDFRPTGVSPLASSESFMAVSCPKCGQPARRDPDTMDTFVCSSWYYLRYPCTDETERPFSPEKMQSWLPVDQYVGGSDHACGHLIFSRFVTKVLHDLGHLQFDEPFLRLNHQGMILSDGEKMSKSKGNVVSPDGYLEQYGTDALRAYMMKGFAFSEGGDWSDEGLEGVFRYLQRVWRLVEAALTGTSPAGDATADPPLLTAAEAEERGAELRCVMHNSIKGCSVDTERFQFNTAISRLMELTNALYAYAGRSRVGLDDQRYREGIEILVKMLAPFAPHLGEELWTRIGGEGHVFAQQWPEWDEAALTRATVTMVVQINGKIRERMEVPVDADRESVAEQAQAHGRIPDLLADQTIRKVIVVPNKLVNIVV
ncbi:MAG: leucine--tRNA ligase [bacterium]